MPTKIHDEERTDIPAMLRAVEGEPFACKLGMKCTRAGPGYARVEIRLEEDHTNLFGTGHGGVLFSLMDEAFQIACNTRGRSAFALNVSVTYIRPAHPGDVLAAEARELALTPRTGTYEITVFDQNGEKLALAQALAYRKKDPVPF